MSHSRWRVPRFTMTPRYFVSVHLVLLLLGFLPASVWLLTRHLPTWALIPIFLAGAIYFVVNYWRANFPESSLNVFWPFVAYAFALMPFITQFGFSVAQLLITDAALRRVFTLG